MKKETGSDNLVRGKALFKQSSELEILISAAIIFAALQISDVINLGITDLLNSNVKPDSPFLVVLAVIGLYLSTLLPISIVVHFILRIFWLSLVGLHSAFPQQDRIEGQYDAKYEKIINRSLDLDRQISRLDQLGSSIFAFSFLTLFSFCFPFASVFGLTYLFYRVSAIPGINEAFGGVVSGILTFTLIVSVLTYALDYVLGGKLKKIEHKTFKKIYFVIYKFMSIITLAPLSRGIYYKLSV